LARHKFAVLSLAAIALVSSFWFLLDVLGMVAHRSPACGVTQFEKRFSGFPKTESNAVYGYLSDNPPNDPNSISEYHLTQYTLAPAIIKLSANYPLVIVNYHSKDLDMRFLRANQLDPYRDYGNGVALCRPRTQP
jgi:hypothetical protein